MLRARLAFVAVAMIVSALVLGIAGHAFAASWLRPETRAEWSVRAGKRGDAEEVLYASMVQGAVTTERLMLFLELHEPAEVTEPPPPRGFDSGVHLPQRRGPKISEAEVDALLARPDIAPETSVLARFVRESEARPRGDDGLRVEMGQGDPLHDRVVAIADADPPAPWANRLLAREALGDDDAETAARRFLREGALVPGHEHDVDEGLALAHEAGGADAVSAALADPRVAAAASPGVRLSHAAEVGAWGPAVRWAFFSAYERPTAVGLAVTLVAALAWMVWLSRIGDLTARPWVRAPLYLAAFALGTLSIWPTDLLIAAQETLLHLRPRGTPFGDLVFFTFGVGFREELSKLLCFAPLLPVLRLLDEDGRRASLDVVVTGALVGLGFAAVENLGYWQGGALATGMTRFLTANFFHMAMTAITAQALYDLTKSPEKQSFEFSTTLVVVMLLHGAYDFFLTSRAFGDLSWFGMAVFFVLTRRFVVALSSARRRAGRGVPPFDLFILGFVLVCSVSFAIAASLVGPSAAILAMLEGLLGIGLVVIVFGRELAKV